MNHCYFFSRFYMSHQKMWESFLYLNGHNKLLVIYRHCDIEQIVNLSPTWNVNFRIFLLWFVLQSYQTVLGEYSWLCYSGSGGVKTCHWNILGLSPCTVCTRSFDLSLQSLSDFLMEISALCLQPSSIHSSTFCQSDLSK